MVSEHNKAWNPEGKEVSAKRAGESTGGDDNKRPNTIDTDIKTMEELRKKHGASLAEFTEDDWAWASTGTGDEGCLYFSMAKSGDAPKNKDCVARLRVFHVLSGPTPVRDNNPVVARSLLSE
eukprot:7720570-Alexandrium_andersonii.AAC.1